MKALVLYHANCIDGFGAAFAAWQKLREDAEYLPMQYGQVNTLLDLPPVVGRDVYILDFSFSRELTEEILSMASKVVWLDHHKTAFEMWCGGLDSPRVKDGRFAVVGYAEYGQIEVILDNNKSGAMLAWEYFIPHAATPPLVVAIDDYDRWQFKEGDTKAIVKAIWSHAPWSFEQWTKYLGRGKSDHFINLVAEGTAILRAHEANVNALVERTVQRCILDGKEGLMSNCPPHLASDAGHKLATQSGTYGLLWYVDSRGVCCCSLRSNGDYDVSAIAKLLGGGGHRNAAGFETDLDTLSHWFVVDANP